MLLLAHTGLTLGAAGAADYALKKSRRQTAPWLPFFHLNIDLRLLMLGSMLPDLDKIIGIYLFPQISNGRIFLHTLLFLALITLVGLVVYRFWRRTWGLVLAAGTLSHLLLDSMWRSPRTLFWPFLQKSFTAVPTEDWLGTIWQRLLAEPGLYIPEIAGGLVLLWFGVWVFRHRQAKSLLFTGRVKR